MELPNQNGIPVNLLAACFKNTSATYKYYWFLSILQSVEHGKFKISKRDLFAGMISKAWFTVNYFHVSFGKQDLIQDVVRAINGIEKISIEEKQESVLHKLLSTKKAETDKQLWHFNKNVPHWFLSPWFPKFKNETDSVREKRIYVESKSFSENCLYALYDNEIEINPEWEKYLISNARVLKDFCYWNLCLFLQAKNPNVPDIPNKLIKPSFRGTLNKQRDEFWKHVFNYDGFVKCIFTDKKLYYAEKNFALDHFVPHAFVSHDLIWNLIPIEKRFNSSKSDKLPNLEKYIDKFFQLQKRAFEINRRLNAKSKYMDEYQIIFPELDDFSQNKLRDVIQPLITIASNNGFEFMK